MKIVKGLRVNLKVPVFRIFRPQKRNIKAAVVSKTAMGQGWTEPYAKGVKIIRNNRQNSISLSYMVCCVSFVIFFLLFLAPFCSTPGEELINKSLFHSGSGHPE